MSRRRSSQRFLPLLILDKLDLSIPFLASLTESSDMCAFTHITISDASPKTRRIIIFVSRYVSFAILLPQSLLTFQPISLSSTGIFGLNPHCIFTCSSRRTLTFESTTTRRIEVSLHPQYLECFAKTGNKEQIGPNAPNIYGLITGPTTQQVETSSLSRTQKGLTPLALPPLLSLLQVLADFPIHAPEK